MLKRIRIMNKNRDDEEIKKVKKGKKIYAKVGIGSSKSKRFEEKYEIIVF